MNATFGTYEWSLPLTEIEYPHSLEKFKWFAKFLLEGEVIEYFKKYSKVLLHSPLTILKSWSKLHPPTQSIIKPLILSSLSSKESLQKMWSLNNNCNIIFIEAL